MPLLHRRAAEASQQDVFLTPLRLQMETCAGCQRKLIVLLLESIQMSALVSCSLALLEALQEAPAGRLVKYRETRNSCLKVTIIHSSNPVPFPAF